MKSPDAGLQDTYSYVTLFNDHVFGMNVYVMAVCLNKMWLPLAIFHTDLKHIRIQIPEEKYYRQEVIVLF